MLIQSPKTGRGWSDIDPKQQVGLLKSGHSSCRGNGERNIRWLRENDASAQPGGGLCRPPALEYQTRFVANLCNVSDLSAPNTGTLTAGSLCFTCTRFAVQLPVANADKIMRYSCFVAS